MASVLTMVVEEYNDATKFKLYDRTDWDGGFDYSEVTSVLITVTYDDTDYTLKVYDTADATNLLGMDATFVSLVGASVNSYYDVSVSALLDGTGAALNSSTFVDGYYEITVDVVHTVEGAMDDTTAEGFIAHAECKASQLPLLIDFNNFDYEEVRIQSLLIALLNSAKRSAQLGRESQFTNKLTIINAFYDARNLSDCW